MFFVQDEKSLEGFLPYGLGKRSCPGARLADLQASASFSYFKTPPLKGQFTRCILIRMFCVCADGLQGLSKSFHCHTIINFSFASLKLHTNFENA
jgi:hypothetical protein